MRCGHDRIQAEAAVSADRTKAKGSLASAGGSRPRRAPRRTAQPHELQAFPKGPIREWQMKTMTQSQPLIAPPTWIQLLLQGKGLSARFLGCLGHGGEHYQMGDASAAPPL